MSKFKEVLSSDCTCRPKLLIASLNSLRENNELLDITLVAEKQAFRAHKVVLAACSDYFRAMFTDNMLEARQSEIVLNGVSAKGFGVLLEYAYTSLLPLNPANVQDVLSAASHVQMLEVVRTCSNYLQTQIDIDNCVDMATTAEIYCLKQLKEKVYKFMSGHLMEFAASSSEFYRLTPQQMENLLKYEFPVDCSEAEVLRIVLSWLCNFDHSEPGLRQGHAARIVQHINFQEITLQQLDNVIESTFSNCPKFDHNLHKLVLTESSRQCSGAVVDPSDLLQPSLLNSRGMEMVLLKIGGFGDNGVTNEITYRLATSQKWRHLTSIPHVEQCNFASVVFNNELYVVGGCFNQFLEETIHPFGFRYSPVLNKWHTITPMKTERCRFSLNVVGGKLYAIGGASEVDDVLLTDLPDTNKCEVYDPTTDTWEDVAPLPDFRSQHAAASYENKSLKCLFVSGGMDSSVDISAVSTLYIYDADGDNWYQGPPMLTTRADHVLLTIGDCLYACGGWMNNPRTIRMHNSTIDRYDILKGTWETITYVPTPRYHAGIVAVGKKIYFIGGFLSEPMFDKQTVPIECYDIDANSWSTLEKYPQDIWEHTCATLYIPKCREDMEVLAKTESSA